MLELFLVPPVCPPPSPSPLPGTPIQNNLSELFSILNLLDHVAHPDMEEFLQDYGDGSAGSTSEAQV